ncbi:MAG: glycosyltransferase [Cyanothece sp. SIO1E1]|nr:glycosyltransferase [Cyanothece sp. SIO1E1]
MNNLSNPLVSVIIPVFNDAERLQTCLHALEHQTYSQNLYEVIVVDNASTIDIKGIVSQFKQARFAYEGHPGSYAARNQGIALARGDVLAFTDADCIPAQNWIEQGVNRFMHTPNCGLVAGVIALFFQQAAHPTAVELYDSIKIGFPQQQFVEESRYGATANLFTSRAVFEAVGLFNHSLKSSGDREWGQRVFAAGYQQIYAEDVCVAHPARATWAQLRKKVIRIMGGHQDLSRRQEGSFVRFITRSLLASLKDFLPPLRMYFYIWTNQRLQGNRQKIQFLLAMLFVRYVRSWERVRLLAGGVSSRG